MSTTSKARDHTQSVLKSTRKQKIRCTDFDQALRILDSKGVDWSRSVPNHGKVISNKVYFGDRGGTAPVYAYDFVNDQDEVVATFTPLLNNISIRRT